MKGIVHRKGGGLKGQSGTGRLFFFFFFSCELLIRASIF